MREVNAAVAAHWNARRGRSSALLVWIVARKIDTGAWAPLGVWSGPFDMGFNVGGQLRTYVGGGALLKMDPLTCKVGLKVRTHKVKLSPVNAEIKDKIMGYNIRNARIEAHVVEFDPVTKNQIAPPERIFKGRVTSAPSITPPVNGEVNVTLSMVSAAESLTRGLARKCSDETLQLRSPGDQLRRYADVSGTVETVWGERSSTVGASGSLIETARDYTTSIWRGQ